MTTALTTTPTGPAEGASAGPVPMARPSEAFLKRVSHDYARHHLILSAGVEDGVEILLVSDSTKLTAVFNVGALLERPYRTETASAEVIAAAIDRAYSDAALDAQPDLDSPAVTVQGSDDVAGDLDAAVREAERDLLSTAGKAPAVRLVDLILFEALLRGASDVHVQPLRDRTLVRYRLDGSLHTVRELPAGLAASVVSRVKVMANLDIAERRAPQDGRATVTIGGAGGKQAGRRVDLRVSTLPSTYGERVVLRLLDPARSPHLSSFSALGMPPAVERVYLEQVSRTSGIVLSTGPTGSGKTTTLYATLAWVSSTNTQGGTQGGGMQGGTRGGTQGGTRGGTRGGCELNMMTIEDPVEYDLSGSGLHVSQTQVDSKKGVTFAAGLRHILRQDPDVIMVGEIRDEETARIAVQSSLTGHLVLSTLHTSDSASAVARLLDLDVEPFLVSSSLSAALAQRLVRTLHKPCAGRGCEQCLGAGFKGRTGVFELLVLDSAIRDLVGRRPPASAVEIKTAARDHGMKTLREAGQTLVRQGLTSLEELTRVIDASEELET